MNPVQVRQAIEKRVVRKLLKDMRDEREFRFSVDCGDEGFAAETKNIDEAMEQIFAVDEARVKFTTKNGDYAGTVFLVMGNDGWDVISDYSSNMTPIMEPIEEYAVKLDQ